MIRPHKQIIVGMSGGVDSSVAAWVLKREGYDVRGLFMKNWEDDDTDEYCSSRQDLIDAVAVAEVIGMDIDVVNFSAEYKDRVFNSFLQEHRSGRTPNPDILCNAEIKFKAFLDHALNLGADAIATGHYAQIAQQDGHWELRKGVDGGKDQSYFLYRLSQTQLARTLFPLGRLRKSEVREIARRAGLPTCAKKDSTGICFIGERPFREFLARYLPPQPGPTMTLNGEQVGTHSGLMYYTIGQRQGLGIGGRGSAWFVAAKDVPKNTLYVVQGHEHPALKTSRLVAEDLSWVAEREPPTKDGYAAKTRYRQPDAPCAALVTGNALHLHFAQPQWAVTPGQSAVVYCGELCLGGGVINASAA